MDWTRLIALLIKAPELVPEVVAVVDARVPVELREAWDAEKARILSGADLTQAATVIAGGLVGAFQALSAGHGEVGPSHAHMG